MRKRLTKSPRYDVKVILGDFNAKIGREPVFRHNALFIDFKAAYDSIARVELYKVIREFGIPKKLTRLYRLTMTNITSQVKYPVCYPDQSTSTMDSDKGIVWPTSPTMPTEPTIVCQSFSHLKTLL